jgi:hypothetical protein
MTTYVAKTSSSAEERALLASLAELQKTRSTCTTYAVGDVYIDGRAPSVPLLAYTGITIAAYVLKPAAAPLNWQQLVADLTCATDMLLSLHVVHDDLAQGAARNITMKDGAFFVIDFGKMRAARADDTVSALVRDTLIELAGWLVRNASAFLEQSRAHAAIPAEYTATFDARMLERYERVLKRAADDAPVQQAPPQRRRIDLSKAPLRGCLTQAHSREL